MRLFFKVYSPRRDLSRGEFFKDRYRQSQEELKKLREVRWEFIESASWRCTVSEARRILWRRLQTMCCVSAGESVRESTPSRTVQVLLCARPAVDVVVILCEFLQHEPGRKARLQTIDNSNNVPLEPDDRKNVQAGWLDSMRVRAVVSAAGRGQ